MIDVPDRRSSSSSSSSPSPAAPAAGDRKSLAKDRFVRWSSGYDRSVLQVLMFAPTHRAMLRALRARHPDPAAPLRLLDVGCGTGVFAARAREAYPNARIFGLDLVREMIRGGGDRWESLGAAAVQGEGERLPFASGTFDAVTCANSFHHYPRQQLAVREMARVLKPDGMLLLVDGYRDAPWGRLLYDGIITRLEKDVHHVSRAGFRELWRGAGLRMASQTVHRGIFPFVLNVGAPEGGDAPRS